jgi:AcrR family transcriptional regulator
MNVSTTARTTRSQPAKRRSNAEVRHALLESASEAFARNGYGGASTKEIAKRAHTSETAIYSHFGSKAALFTEAVIDPFIGFLNDYKQAFRTEMDNAREDRQFIATWLEQLYDHLHAERNSVLALISASGEPEAQPAVRRAVSAMQDMFDELFELSAEVWQVRGGFELERAKLWHRLATGMMISLTALEPLLLPDGWHKPTRQEILDTATDLLHTGMVGVPPPRPAEPPSS